MWQNISDNRIDNSILSHEDHSDITSAGMTDHMHAHSPAPSCMRIGASSARIMCGDVKTTET
jgi:hypothetical protein